MYIYIYLHKYIYAYILDFMYSHAALSVCEDLNETEQILQEELARLRDAPVHHHRQPRPCSNKNTVMYVYIHIYIYTNIYIYTYI